MTNETPQNEQDAAITSGEPSGTAGQAEENTRSAAGQDAHAEPGRTPGQAEGEADWLDENRGIGSQQQERSPISRSFNGHDGRQQDDTMQIMQEQFDTLRQQLENGLQQIKESTRKEFREEISPQEFDWEEFKRWGSLFGGGFLALYGLRRSFGSLALMGVGAGMLYYAVTGRRPLSSLLQKRQVERLGHEMTRHAPPSATQSATTKNIIVQADINKVYDTWANFENFPHFMQHIESVTKTGARTSHWVMRGPLDTRLEWDAETTRLEENKRIAWNSIGGDIKTSGQVTFNALPDGQVEVTVMLKYVPPAGLAGEVAAALFGDPEGRLLTDLRNFKRYIEQRASEAA